MATKRNELQVYLKPRIDGLQGWVKGSIDARTLTRFALLEYSKSPKLRECSPESIYLSLIAAAQLGLEPSGITGDGYIIPYKGTASFQPGYRGLIKLAMRNGVQSITAQVVYDNDECEIELGDRPGVRHRPTFDDRGDACGVYAIAKLDSGELVIEVMNWADVMKVRKKAAADSGAWRDFPEEMARKVVIKRLAKKLPLSPEYHKAAALSNASETGDSKAYNEIIDAESTDILDAEIENEDAHKGTEGLKKALGK